MTQGDGAGPPVSRRTTLKAGAHAAWAVPVISAAAAAPAFASTGAVSLVLDDFGAEYTADETGARGDQLTTHFALRSTGTTPATDLTFSFLIPPGLYATAPNVINAPATWIRLSDGIGSFEDGWELRWFRSGELGPGQTTGNESDPFKIQFLDPLVDQPYRRWAAKAFTAGLQVVPSNGAAVSGSYAVPIGPPATFPVLDYAGSYLDNYVYLSGTAQNFGRSSSEDVTLRFWWNPEPGDPAWGTAPAAASSPQLGVGAVTGGGTSGDDPWYITFLGGHGPTATRASFELNASQEEIDTTLVPFNITLTLAAAPTHSRDFYMTVVSDDSTAPVAGTGPGWHSCVVTPGIVDT